MASYLGKMQIQALIRDESKDEQQNEDAEGSEHSKEGHGNGEHGHCSPAYGGLHRPTAIMLRLCSARKSAYASSLTLSTRNGGAFQLLS
jgi:hypothetical protein